MRHAALDQLAVPTGPILLLERLKDTFLIDAGGNAGDVEGEQRRQCVHVRMGRRPVLEQQLVEAERVFAEEWADGLLRIAAGLSLAEEQIQSFQPRSPPSLYVRKAID